MPLLDRQDHQGDSNPLTVSPNYTSMARKQAFITDYFRDYFEAVLQRARRKGFVALHLQLVNRWWGKGAQAGGAAGRG